MSYYSGWENVLLDMDHFHLFTTATFLSLSYNVCFHVYVPHIALTGHNIFPVNSYIDFHILHGYPVST